MKTMLISNSEFTNVQEITNWVNSLIDRTIPNDPNSIIKKIVHFQLILRVNTYDTVLLVEVESKDADLERSSKNQEEDDFPSSGFFHPGKWK